MYGLLATPKLTSAELGGSDTRLFKARSKYPIHPTFPGLTLEQWNLLFNYWKEDIILKTYPILIPEETPIIPALTVIASNLTVHISPFSPILEEMFILSTPDVVTSKHTIVELSTVPELKADIEPPPAVKQSIKPGDWKSVLS